MNRLNSVATRMGPDLRDAIEAMPGLGVVVFLVTRPGFDVNAVSAGDQFRDVRIEKLHPERDASESGHRFDGAPQIRPHSCRYGIQTIHDALSLSATASKRAIS